MKPVIEGLDSGIVYIGYFLAVAALFIVYEIIYRVTLSCFHRLPIQPNVVDYAFVENKILEGKKLIIYEDSILDIESYLPNHPGIDGLLNEHIGKEIGRFIYGGIPCSTFSPHNHSYEALELIERLKIGTLSNVSRDSIFLPLEAGIHNPKGELWTLIGKKTINKAYSVFRFKCPKFRSSAMLPGVAHCGKYYAVNITRN